MREAGFEAFDNIAGGETAGIPFCRGWWQRKKKNPPGGATGLWPMTYVPQKSQRLWPQTPGSRVEMTKANGFALSKT